MQKLRKTILSLLLIAVIFISVPVARASVTELSSQFVGYNIVSATVTNGVYLRGAPYDITEGCQIYFYKINGNNIYIAPGKTVYVIECEGKYFYIAYKYNGTYYCGYVPAGDISCSGFSWCKHDILWPGLYNGIPEGGSRIQNVCYGPGDASYFLRWSSINVDYVVSTLLLRKTNRYAFVQHMIDDGGVLKYVRGWVWGSYINPWPNYDGTNIPFFYFDSQIASCYESEKSSQESTVYIINGDTNKALTVSSTADRTIVTTETFTGSIRQEFSLVKTGHYPSTYKLYSQYAQKFVEVDHDVSDGAYLRTRSVSNGYEKQEFATIPWSRANNSDTNTIIGVRSSGFYNALTVDSSNRVIMHKREAINTYNWHIRPKLWNGGLNFKTVDPYGDVTVKYSIDSSINNSTHVKPEMVVRAAEYWNICAEANLQSFLSPYDFTLSQDSGANYFKVKYVNRADAPVNLQNAYAYFVAKDINNMYITDKGGITAYYNDWVNIELCIIRENTAYLGEDEIVKILAHEFGHCLKMPHTAVNNDIVSVLNTGNVYMFPDFNRYPTANSGNAIADYDRVRLGKKQY